MGSSVVAPLQAALDGLAGVDAAALGDDELGAALVELSRIEARFAAQRARLVACFEARRGWMEDGYRSASAWLADRGAMAPRRARAEVRLARRLRDLPAVAAGLGDGSLGLDAAQAITRLHRPPLARALLRDEPTLVDQARRLELVELERVLRYWEQLADPDGVEAAAAVRDEHRRFSCAEGVDGVWLDGWLPAVQGAMVRAELDCLEHELFVQDWKAAVAEHGPDVPLERLARSGAQRMADALVEMARRSASTPPDAQPPRPLITILAGYETFAGRICQLATGPTLTPGEVAALLDQAVIERVVFDTPARVLEVGQARFFTGALRRAIQVRDRTCTGAGCHVPAERCESDHLQPAAAGGPTTQDNGRLRCPFHHRQRHRNSRPPPA